MEPIEQNGATAIQPECSTAGQHVRMSGSTLMRRLSVLTKTDILCLVNIYIDSICLERSVYKCRSKHASIFWPFANVRVANPARPALGCLTVEVITFHDVSYTQAIKLLSYISLKQELSTTTDQ